MEDDLLSVLPMPTSASRVQIHTLQDEVNARCNPLFMAACEVRAAKARMRRPVTPLPSATSASTTATTTTPANPSRPWLPAYRVGLLARKREKYDLQDYRDYVEFLNWLNTRPSGLNRRQLVEPDISARTFIFTRQIHHWDALMARYSSQRLKQK